MRKIKLLEVGHTLEKMGFVAYSAGIYGKKMSVSNAERAASPITTIFSASWEDDLPSDPVNVNGVTINSSILQEVATLSDLRLQEGSFYFDLANQILYFCKTDYKNLLLSDTIFVGDVIGFISEAQLTEINGVNYPLNTRVGSLHYEPRLNDIDVSEELDDQQHGLFIFDDLSASINNADGTYDHVRTDVTGNNAKLSIADIADSPEEGISSGFPYKLAAEADDFNIVRTGIVEDVEFTDPLEPTITAIDIRSDWTQTIGVNLMTTAEFSGLPADYVNVRKPIAIGSISGIPCIPLRADGAAGSFDYFICDITYGTIQSISSVYFNGEISGTKEDRYLTGGEYSVNLSTGIITVNNVNSGSVWVYGVFTTMNETAEIALYTLATFQNLAYIGSNFNVPEIEVIKALDYQAHIYVPYDGLEVRDIIEKLMADAQIDFYQQGSVLTMRAANTERVSIEAIPTHEIIDNPPPWENDRLETIKTIAVGYNKDYRTDQYITYYDNSKQTEAVNNNRKAIDKLFDTNLTNQNDVISIYGAYYSRFINISRTVTIDRTIPFTAGLGDFVTFPVVRKTLDEEKEIFANGVYKIISIDKIENSAQAIYFRDEPDRGLILEWSETPSIIWDYSEDANRIILEAN